MRGRIGRTTRAGKASVLLSPKYQTVMRMDPVAEEHVDFSLCTMAGYRTLRLLHRCIFAEDQFARCACSQSQR